MPTLHLVHGLPGSGKTTFAVRLARETNAVRFTHDEWMVTLHGCNPPEAVFRPQAARIFQLIWAHAARVLATGTDVVIDAGFWTRTSRDEARRWAAGRGAACRFYAMDVSLAEARQRVLARTAALPDATLEITGPTFDVLAAQLEPMGPDEPHELVPATWLARRAVG
jgi:predicted kinase